MATPLPGVWGIDLGQCALKALRLELVDGTVKATAFDYIEHPKILSQPDADPDQLVREALTQFLSRNNIRGDMVVISVPGQSGLARFVKLPPVEEKKIADIVRFEAKQQIPFPLEEVVWDFQKVNEGTVTDGFALEAEIGLFAMKRDMVNRSLQHFKDVNVEVHVIQMAPLALTNFVAYDLLQKKEASDDAGAKKDCIVALDIGTDNSNLVITDAGKIIWQRPIPLGGNHFTRALTKDLKLTFAKAEHLKRNAVKSPELKKILASLKPVLNDFVGEVQRSLGYFTNTHRDANIQYMVGLGNAFRLPGIQKYLQEKLQLEVRKLQTFDRVEGGEVLSAPQFTENIMSFGVPYGLALQGLGQTKLRTNLLPYEVRVERLVRGKKPWAVAAAASLLLAVAMLTLGQSLIRADVDNPKVTEAMKNANAAIKKYNDFKAQEAEVRKQIDDSEKAIDRISAGVKERFQWHLMMQYINMALPQPNGAKLTTRSIASNNQNLQEMYYDQKARTAYQQYEQRRFTKAGEQVDAEKAARLEEMIKANLVQVSIEGVNAMYTEDLAVALKKVYKDLPTLKGMREDEKQMIIEDKNLPTKGHLIEIRGYTYHHQQEKFVIDTLLENLKSPEQENVNKGNISAEMRKDIMGNLGFIVLYRAQKVPNPELGIFKLIRTSHLRTLLRGESSSSEKKDQLSGAQPGMSAQGGMPVGKGDEKEGAKQVSRDGWTPLGAVAVAALSEGGGSGAGSGAFVVADKGSAATMPKDGGQPVGTAPKKAFDVPRQERYEFIVLMVWKDPPTSTQPADAPRK